MARILILKKVLLFLVKIFDMVNPPKFVRNNTLPFSEVNVDIHIWNTHFEEFYQEIGYKK